MLNSIDAPCGANDAIASGNQPAFQSPNLSPRSTTTAIDARSLPPGKEFIVDTANSRYRFVMCAGYGSHAHALAQGGRYFPEDTEVDIDGSTDGGCLLRIGQVELGLSLELSFRGTRIVTSPVRSISIAG